MAEFDSCEEKRKRFNAYADSIEGSWLFKLVFTLKDPPLVSLLNRIGIDTPPAIYWNPVSYFLYMSVAFGVLSALAIKLLHLKLRHPVLQEAVFLGLGFGLLMSVHQLMVRWLHRPIRPWDEI